MRGGTIGGYNRKPHMDLVYTAQIFRPVNRRERLGSLTAAFVPLNNHVPCDVAPVRDDIRFAQQGETGITTHVVHFAEGVDIRKDDLIKILSSRRLGGPIGAYFIILERLQPSEEIGYIRCHATYGVAPIA
jgi:hypothetical protein